MIEADKKETIIVGYAFLEDESEEERAALQRRLEKTFGTDHLLYLAGDKEDVENAKKAGKSLGIYLAEQILAGENFHKVVNEATEEEVLELLEKNPCSMTDQALKEMIQQKLSDYEDADDLEKEENADRDDEQNEDILEPQKERNEEQEESASGEKLEEVGESKESDELDTINEPESQVEEHESDTQDISDEPAEPTEEIDSYEMESEDDSTESEGEAVKISTSRSVTIVRVPFTLSLSRIDKAITPLFSIALLTSSFTSSRLASLFTLIEYSTTALSL